MNPTVIKGLSDYDYDYSRYGDTLNSERLRQLREARQRRQIDVMRNRLKVQNPITSVNRLKWGEFTPALLLALAGGFIGYQQKGAEGAVLGSAGGLALGGIGNLLGKLKASVSNIDDKELASRLNDRSLLDYTIPGRASATLQYLDKYTLQNEPKKDRPTQYLI